MNIMKEKASHLSRELKKDWSISISHDSGAIPVAVGRSWSDAKWKTAHHESFERHRLVRWRVRLGSMAIFILKDNTQTIIDSTRSCDLSLSNTFVDTRGAMTVNGNLSFGQDTVVCLGTGGGWDSGFWARKRMQRFQPHVARARSVKNYYGWLTRQQYGKRAMTSASKNTPVEMAGRSNKLVSFGEVA